MKCELLVPNIKYHGLLCDCYENQDSYFLLYKGPLNAQNLQTIQSLDFLEKEPNQYIKSIHTEEYINIVL